MSPASEPTAVTVGASTKSGDVASFSNTGECITLYAPGEKTELGAAQRVCGIRARLTASLRPGCNHCTSSTDNRWP